MGIAITDETRAGAMTKAEFRAFQLDRPHYECWELIAGVPIMMVPPKLIHNLIASNLSHVLNEALKIHRPSVVGLQRCGLELQSDSYCPEPDVCVLDLDFDIDQRYIERGYLLAEIVSSTDEFFVPGRRERWIDVKRELYRAHEPCEAILIVNQTRIEVDVDLRTPTGWVSATLRNETDMLDLPTFGVHCRLRDLYDRTHLVTKQSAP